MVSLAFYLLTKYAKTFPTLDLFIPVFGLFEFDLFERNRTNRKVKQGIIFPHWFHYTDGPLGLNTTWYSADTNSYDWVGGKTAAEPFYEPAVLWPTPEPLWGPDVHEFLGSNAPNHIYKQHQHHIHKQLEYCTADSKSLAQGTTVCRAAHVCSLCLQSTSLLEYLKNVTVYKTHVRVLKYNEAHECVKNKHAHIFVTPTKMIWILEHTKTGADLNTVTPVENFRPSIGVKTSARQAGRTNYLNDPFNIL